MLDGDIHGVRGCYTVLQGVTWCYMVLEGVTLCYQKNLSFLSSFGLARFLSKGPK